MVTTPEETSPQKSENGFWASLGRVLWAFITAPFKHLWSTLTEEGYSAPAKYSDKLFHDALAAASVHLKEIGEDEIDLVETETNSRKRPVLTKEYANRMNANYAKEHPEIRASFLAFLKQQSASNSRYALSFWTFLVAGVSLLALVKDGNIPLTDIRFAAPSHAIIFVLGGVFILLFLQFAGGLFPAERIEFRQAVIDAVLEYREDHPDTEREEEDEDVTAAPSVATGVVDTAR